MYTICIKSFTSKKIFMPKPNQKLARIQDVKKLDKVQAEFSRKTGRRQSLTATIDFALTQIDRLQSGEWQIEFSKRMSAWQIEQARNIASVVSLAKDASPDARIVFTSTETTFALVAVMPDGAEKTIYDATLFTDSPTEILARAA